MAVTLERGNDGKIQKLIDDGAEDLESLSQATGACSGCGACDTDIQALLAEYLSSDARAGR